MGKVLFVILLFALLAPGSSADEFLEQKVKFHQAHTKWAIKDGQQRIRDRASSLSRTSQTQSHGRSAGFTVSSSGSSARGSRTSTVQPAMSASKAMTNFMSAVYYAKRLEDLYPYTCRTRAEYWQRLSQKDKGTTLARLKAWTRGATVEKEESQPYVSTLTLRSSLMKGANLVNEGGCWKFSNEIVRR